MCNLFYLMSVYYEKILFFQTSLEEKGNMNIINDFICTMKS
ncbi:hypothetical protein M096_3059 [Parabacteroides distasonis str. 3999B T(B) 6]|nr:hypothetical protein M095_3177 [Parabacteroides distasonis str. 3999B T(B) 4]KDS70669.1 hypothetical protein M096_3059 [Parabacteroides distasonis str. 3999B T(B) 6]